MEIKEVVEHTPDTNLWMKRDKAYLAIDKYTDKVVVFKWDNPHEMAVSAMLVISLEGDEYPRRYTTANTFNQAFRPFQGELTLVQED